MAGIPILVVDDDDTLRGSLVWILRDEGYAVCEAPDGKPALERLREHAGGMVVWLNPDMSGVDGLRVLPAVFRLPFTSQRAHQHIPVVTKPPDRDELFGRIAAPAAQLRAEPEAAGRCLHGHARAGRQRGRPARSTPRLRLDARAPAPTLPPAGVRTTRHKAGAAPPTGHQRAARLPP